MLKEVKQETIENIKKCLFEYHCPCELKIEHGEIKVIAIKRTPMLDAKAKSKN